MTSARPVSTTAGSIPTIPRYRVRLNSTAIAIEPDQRITRVTYGWSGNLHRVEAVHVVLAGYNMMIPFIMPGLPAPRKQALRSDVKAPVVYTQGGAGQLARLRGAQDQPHPCAGHGLHRPVAGEAGRRAPGAILWCCTCSMCPPCRTAACRRANASRRAGFPAWYAVR
ncbi:hypothetical protein ACU4GD_33140 [Cupriavidus basilensis]